MSEPIYKMQPAGHEATASRRKYSEPDRKLRDAFEKYLALVTESSSRLIYDQMCRSDLYSLAVNLLKDTQVSIEEAHGLLLERELSAKERDYGGFFVSAIYNKSDVKDILYDLDVEVWNLAYALPASKAFINKGLGHGNSGTLASGIILNYVKPGTFLKAGFAAEGPVVTYGAEASTGYWVGDFDEGDEQFVDSVSLEVSLSKVFKIKGRDRDPDLRNGVIVRKDPQKASPRCFVHEEEIEELPELDKYISGIKSKFFQGRYDHNLVVETVRALGPNPNVKIRQDLVEILRRAGKDV